MKTTDQRKRHTNGHDTHSNIVTNFRFLVTI